MESYTYLRAVYAEALNYPFRIISSSSTSAEQLYSVFVLFTRQYELVFVLYIERSIITAHNQRFCKAQYRSKVLAIFDQIPGLLSGHEKRVVFKDIQKVLLV